MNIVDRRGDNLLSPGIVPPAGSKAARQLWAAAA
jgi:hypothetical protein